VFPGVDLAGGACYFLWDRDENGLCAVTNNLSGTKVTQNRYLNEFSTFIRQNQAVEIVRNILSKHQPGQYLAQVVSSRKPFGLPTNYQPLDTGVPCWFKQRIGLKFAALDDVHDPNNLLNKWKLLLPIAPIAGQTDFSKPVRFYYSGNTVIARPGQCCTESFFVANAFDSEQEVLSFQSYLFTKIARFLLLQAVVSQHVSKKNFCFVPDIGPYNKIYTDGLLRERWSITGEEWNYIDAKIATIR
jgi:site-specific DNA-methyltransferase (adenine-specific)